MSFQHRNLAAIWRHLAGRADIPRILSEIIGHHTLQVVSQESASDRIDQILQTIIWIKTVLDLQRCYISGLTDDFSGIEHLLIPRDALLSSFRFLLDIKVRWLSQQNEEISENKNKELAHARLLLAQTLLAILRLLKRMRGQISKNTLLRLRACFISAWKNDSLQGIERLIVQNICGPLLQSLDNPGKEDSCQKERQLAGLPSYTAGLYPLHVTEAESVIQPLIHAMAEEDEDWIDAYMVLYDFLWTFECAITQRYVDIKDHVCDSAVSIPDRVEDEILDQLQQQRTHFIMSIFHVKGPVLPSTLVLRSLASTLLEWSHNFDVFLARQDSLRQERLSVPQTSIANPNYGKHVLDLQDIIHRGSESLLSWIATRGPGSLGAGHAANTRSGLLVPDHTNPVKDWITRISGTAARYVGSELEESLLPVYMVDCPKLHAIPKQLLAEQLRWCDKWAYEGVQENTPFLTWKEGVQCPSCESGSRIKCARLIEPLETRQKVLHPARQEGYSSSQYSVDGNSSYIATSSSDSGTRGVNLPSPTAAISTPTSYSHSYSEGGYSKPSPKFDSVGSPYSMGISPRKQSQASVTWDNPVSPLNESLNVPIPLASTSRSSVELPIPIHSSQADTKWLGDNSGYSIPYESYVKPDSDVLAGNSQYVGSTKPKSTGRATRFGYSVRRKSSSKEKESHPLSKNARFTFSASGHSLLLWGSEMGVVRFDVPSANLKSPSSTQCCRYEVDSVEIAAAGHRKCVALATFDATRKSLFMFNGMSTAPESSLLLECFGKTQDMSMALSKDDRILVLSTRDRVDLFHLENGFVKVPFDAKPNLHEMTGSTPQPPSESSNPGDKTAPRARLETNKWFAEHSRGLNSREEQEEQQRKVVVVSRVVNFSTNGQHLVIATQLGDHCVYIDVWDTTREEISTHSDHSRSFKLPPWTLNDGDLNSVFFDTSRNAALITAFLGKEYPILVPFQAFNDFQNETYSTKVIATALSPSGSTFVVANGVTEMIQFQYTAKGVLAPHRLKKSSSKISSSVFKPGAMALSMPSEDCLRIFWIKDGKCVLRSVNIGFSEVVHDVDLKPLYDELLSQKDRLLMSPIDRPSISELSTGSSM